MTHPETQQIIDRVEQTTGYRVTIDVIDGIHESAQILQRVIQMDPLSEIAEQARNERRRIAHETMRDNVGGGLRMDAMFYCLDAIKKFREMGDARMRALVYEITMLGRGGLDINDAEQKYTLTSLPGKFSGMQLVSLMYTGFKQIDPSLDGGIDLSREYEQALNLSKTQ